MLSLITSKLASLKNVGMIVLTTIGGILFLLYKSALKKAEKLVKDKEKLIHTSNTSAETIRQAKKTNKMTREFQRKINKRMQEKRKLKK